MCHIRKEEFSQFITLSYGHREIIDVEKNPGTHPTIFLQNFLMTGKTTDRPLCIRFLNGVSFRKKEEKKVRHFGQYHHGAGKLVMCKFLTFLEKKAVSFHRLDDFSKSNKQKFLLAS
jgi:hypothetical protein